MASVINASQSKNTKPQLGVWIVGSVVFIVIVVMLVFILKHTSSHTNTTTSFPPVSTQQNGTSMKPLSQSVPHAEAFSRNAKK